MIECVFFDVGSTLGDVNLETWRLTPYPKTKKMLVQLRDLGLKLGVISNVLETMSSEDIVAMLDNADLGELFDRRLIVTSTSGHGEKPQASIYQHAASLAGLPCERCMFVGENLAEVIGARAAGMDAQLKTPPTPKKAA